MSHSGTQIPLGSIPKYDDIKRVFDSEESALRWLVDKRVLQIPVFLGKSKLAFHHSLLMAYLWLAEHNSQSMFLMTGCDMDAIEAWIQLCRLTVFEDLKLEFPDYEGQEKYLMGEKIWRQEHRDKLWDGFLMAAVRSVNRKLEVDELSGSMQIDLSRGPDGEEYEERQVNEGMTSLRSFRTSVILEANEIFKTLTNVSETTKKSLGAVAFRLMNGVDEIEPLADGQQMSFGFHEVYENEVTSNPAPVTMDEVAHSVDVRPLVTGNDISVYDKLKASQADVSDIYNEGAEDMFIFNGTGHKSP